ncbi:MAG: hypothetical protein NTW86_23755, partial [Candidatus Sumerlaeota bacterium]|nr:hypothetical protein [Candidatus Sumerlaeota bacterium]
KHMPPDFMPRADLPDHVVRACYLVPSNSVAQSGAVEKFQHNILQEQEWYRDQMERFGFGPKTFEFEKEEGSDRPMIHVVNAPNVDSYYAANPFNRLRVAAQNAGLPVMSPKQVWCIVGEIHTMNPDGSVTGIYNGGSSNGSGDDPGLAVTCGLWLAMATEDYLVDDRAYGGLVEPGVGPYPMVQNLTFASFEGGTCSGVSSTAHGVIVHEAAHAFGLWHDYRNDINACGNLMFNGLRGVRGWAYPRRYLDNECRLEYASALALNVSRYFNGPKAYNDDVKPFVAILTSGNVAPVNGKLEIRFTADDAGGLAAALLRKGAETVEEMPLSGTSVDRTFSTAWHDPGQSVAHTVVVYDTQGNHGDAATTIVSQSGYNCAPKPFVRIRPSRTLVNEPVSMVAEATTDPDDAASQLTVEWDVDGDDAFETAPTTNKTCPRDCSDCETTWVRARIVDPHGAWALSTPIGVRVELPHLSAVQSSWNRYE